MSETLDQAQARLDKRKKELGITWSRGSDSPMRREQRLRDAHARALTNPEAMRFRGKERGRAVRCVSCGHERRVETTRRRRLKTIPCEQLRGDDVGDPLERCGGRLRPLNWFRVD